jgi:excisionase family DNA binding protein
MPTSFNPFCPLNHAVPEPPTRPVEVGMTAAAIGPTDGGSAAAAPGPPPVFHTVEEVAHTLGVSTRTVNRGIAGGFIRKVAMGGRLVRISSAELQRLAANAPLPPAVASDAVSTT